MALLSLAAGGRICPQLVLEELETGVVELRIGTVRCALKSESTARCRLEVAKRF